MIQVEGLSKSFRDLRRGQVLAVDQISFEARAGEVFGLLGPNGAGKTTAMRILCTVLRPTGGTARIAGFDVLTEASAVRRHIGFLSANTAHLRELGKCILFSTHIMREVEKLCDRVAIVSQGRIQACGTLRELRDRYEQQDLEELFFQLVS